MARASRRTLPALAAAAALAAVAAAVVLAATSSGGGATVRADSPAERRALSAAERFLDGYVEPDGRVVRRDQGGDTVSEGQAYAMLVAVAIGDRERFDAAWDWARDNLQRRDGLLSFHWRDGEVVDREAATDADVDAAHALVLAARRFGERAYRRQGVRIARAVLAHETVRLGGQRVLVAGPWARATRTINPSYFAPRAFAVLRRATGDRRWRSLERTSHRLTADLTDSGPRLPPDWGVATGPGGARAIPPPSDPSKGLRYAYDAARTPLRMAFACDRRSRRLAARPWGFLAGQAGGGTIAAEYALDGRRLVDHTHPLALAGAAAGAKAAGRRGSARRLLAEADRADREFPTYYGAAWAALGRITLTTTWLGRCSG